MFKRFFEFIKKDPAAECSCVQINYSEDGVEYSISGKPVPRELAEAFEFAVDLESADRFLALYLAQLLEEGHALLTQNGVRIPWADIYCLVQDLSHEASIDLLQLPSIHSIAPLLNARGTLSDKSFDLVVEGWLREGLELRDVSKNGPVLSWKGQSALLPLKAWEVDLAVRQFRQRPEAERNQLSHEMAWGRIRKLAAEAGAHYASQYLYGTVVITPDCLQLPMEKAEALGERVVVVSPTFEGAPGEWLEKFDSYHEVQEHYDFSTEGGRVRVIVPEPVRQVLSFIKREMPGRRVAGTKAQAFVHNPFAFFGELAHEAIDSQQFEQEKAAGGIYPTVFSIVTILEQARIQEVALLVTVHYPDGTAASDRPAFTGPDELAKFLKKLQSALEAEHQYLPWGEYDLEIDGEATVQLEKGLGLLSAWKNQAPETINFEDVYAIENYGERIEGIGVAKPIAIPVFARPKEGDPDWAPGEDVVKPFISVTLPGHEGQVLIPLDKKWCGEFEKKVAEAESSNAPSLQDDKLPTEIPTKEARTLIDSLMSVVSAADKVKKTDKGTGGEKPKTRRETLLVKHNVQNVDYQEERKLLLSCPEDRQPDIPRSLRPEIKLLPHQEKGVAWLQHLLALAPTDCRGALLADDMGLGKTLQLLTVIGDYYERHPDAPPTLVVAPVSLLDNWAQEARKFFDETFPKILTLYGDSLQELKQPKGYIDERLIREKHITNLLKPDWLGAAKIVLTTYETLRDYEFSLARQEFDIMVCDEAQKIKTPNALVTLAAKKQKVMFKVACTGTPVENTLADLWCLFDFIQPGFLGALDQFSRNYRRPIEAKTPEQKAAVEELRELIAAQLLRREKKDIAENLPEKIFVQNNPNSKRLEVEISPYQRQLYVDGLKKLRQADGEEDARKRARISFEILHFIKAVCAEPYCLPRMRFAVDERGIEAHLKNSPKMDWLLKSLDEIKAKGDKVIIFTELREVQNALCHFLKEFFQLKPFVINGDTKTRQELIDRFQAKDGFDAIVLSPLAAGFGLNIVKANHVIHFTRTWNPAKEAQATDRAYRIGAQKNVYVYCPTVVAADFTTFESKLHDLMLRKRELADDMLDGTGADMSFSDLKPDDGPDGIGMVDRHLELDDVDRLAWDSFEVACQLLWEKQGYLSYVTDKVGGDGGIDVIAIKSPSGDLVQVKHSGVEENQLGWDAIKEVTGGAARYQASHPGIRFLKVAVTNQHFNPAAKEQAEMNRVRLIERVELGNLLRGFPILRSELDDALMRYLQRQTVAA